MMGRFLIGFVVGAAIGATAVVLLSPRSGEQNRTDLSEQFNQALEIGRQAAAAHEQELWQRFRAQINGEAEPPPLKPDADDLNEPLI
jgi:gas vesicle protein